MKVHFHTFGCKANQYDTDRMRQELEGRGAVAVAEPGSADVCVVNTCTVTNEADSEARRLVRRLHRRHSRLRIVVAGCSAALRAQEYRALEGVCGVVEGHDPVEVAERVDPGPALVPLGERRPQPLLARHYGGTRAWLKIQDGCDRHCSFCATRLARGAGASRLPADILAEARLLAQSHPEIVLTGIHIGHYGRDLVSGPTLAALVQRLVDAVPDVRFRLSSIEATEVEDGIVRLMSAAPDRLAPHFHMPLQSGSDRILRLMRRWHTREQYRRRALDVAAALCACGLGGDVIAGFPGETDADHADTRSLIAELPYTYLHVFPYSAKDGTHAATLPGRVPRNVAAARARELRELAHAKGRNYRAKRLGQPADVVLEGSGRQGLTGDYLRVRTTGPAPLGARQIRRVLRGDADHLYIDMSQPALPNE